MKFEYKIKGVTLNDCDMYEIKEFYEAYCTAEYIIDNYDVTEEEAVKLGYEVRRLMNRYGYDEETAIDEVLIKEDVM